MDGAVVELYFGHSAGRHFEVYARGVAIEGEAPVAVAEGVLSYAPIFVPAAYHGAFDGLSGAPVGHLAANQIVLVAHHVVIVGGLPFLLGYVGAETGYLGRGGLDGADDGVAAVAGLCGPFMVEQGRVTGLEVAARAVLKFPPAHADAAAIAHVAVNLAHELPLFVVADGVVVGR